MSVCQACEAPIRWARTAAGRNMPLNADPDDDGNVYLNTDGTCVTLAPPMDDEYRALGFRLYMPHHATCPNADQFRRPR